MEDKTKEVKKKWGKGRGKRDDKRERNEEGRQKRENEWRLKVIRSKKEERRRK